MMARLLCASALLAAWFTLVGNAADEEGVTLTGWGIDEKDPDNFMARAAEVGFDALITWNTDPRVLARDVAAGDKHGIRIYSCISPMGGLANLWKKQYPDRPVPWQVMTEAEQAAATFIAAGRNQYLIPYQFGGEPLLTNEVLTTPIICLSSVDARELLKPTIDGIVGVPGIAGLALDGFGYQNYNRCHCDRCSKLLDDYCGAHPDVAPQEACVTVFRDMLVETINHLADYARSHKPEVKVAIHIWPAFAPDPLYGNRLDVDECGQTAAWYTIWPAEKIARYSRIIAEQAKRYYPRQEGVGMIGYYDRPGQFPVKDAAQVDLELATMLANGCRSIQVCATQDVLRNAEVAEVFRKHFR
jgi:hypothetical protein